jgi:hypothetical protein
LRFASFRSADQIRIGFIESSSRSAVGLKRAPFAFAVSENRAALFRIAIEQGMNGLC